MYVLDFAVVIFICSEYVLCHFVPSFGEMSHLSLGRPCSIPLRTRSPQAQRMRTCSVGGALGAHVPARDIHTRSGGLGPPEKVCTSRRGKSVVSCQVSVLGEMYRGPGHDGERC